MSSDNSLTVPQSSVLVKESPYDRREIKAYVHTKTCTQMFVVSIEEGANVGLQLFVWKNNTIINKY